MEPKQTFPSLTGLKGLFIWLIIWFHTAPDTPLIASIPGSSLLKLYGGSMGNSMFFLLSGFLLSWGYRDRIRAHALPFPDYLRRRLKKLYPTYLLSSLVMLLLEVLEYGASTVNLQRIAFDLLLQSGGGLSSSYPYNGPGWFVSALFVCYLVYYLIAYHTKHDTAYRCAIAFGIVWGYALLRANLPIPFCFSQNGTAFLNFFTGCALAEIYPCLTSLIRKKLQLTAILILPASLILMLLYGVEIICGDTRVVYAFVFCPLILYLAIENRLCVRILSSKIVLWLGKISMALYFWHYVFYVGYRWLLRLAGRSIGDLEFLIYLVLLILLCALPIGKGSKKREKQAAQ